MHPWGEFPDKNIMELVTEPTLDALEDAGVDWKDIEMLASGCWPWGGTGSSSLSLGNRLAEKFGETGIPIVNVYAACATPTTSIREGVMRIENGECDIALVVGVDKSPEGFFTTSSEDPTDEYFLRSYMVGATNPTYWALEARRRMEKIGTTEEHIAMVKEKNSKHASLNPNARYQKVFTVDDILDSPMVADPLHLYEIGATSDGAAAVVLCNMDKAYEYTDEPVEVLGAATGTSKYSDPAIRIPYLCCNTAEGSYTETFSKKYSEIRSASQRAFERAGVDPGDLDVLELHDTCSYNEIPYSEVVLDLEAGEGDRLLEDGETELGGNIPINPSGGTSSLGEAVAAQGIAQIYELIQQLRGNAGERQVEDAEIGLGQTYGAYGNSSVTILRRS